MQQNILNDVVITAELNESENPSIMPNKILFVWHV
jgi:hypothetical protein